MKKQTTSKKKKPYQYQKTKSTTPPKKKPLQTQPEKPPTKPPSKASKITKTLSENIIEIFLLIIGLFFLLSPRLQNTKISFTLLLIASILVFLMTGEQQTTTDLNKTYATKNPYQKKRQPRNSVIQYIQSLLQKTSRIPLSNRISIVLILWTLLLFVLIGDLEVYFILVFIGMLITREITDLHTSKTYKKRLDAYILVFLITFCALLIQKILAIIST